MAFRVSSPNFLSTNDALRVVKATEKANEAHVYLTPLQRAQCFIALTSPGSNNAVGDEGGISGDFTDFPSTNNALRTAKAIE